MSRSRASRPWGWPAMVALVAVLSVGCGETTPAQQTGDTGGGGAGGSGANGAGGSTGTEGGAPASDGLADGFARNPVEVFFPEPDRAPWDFESADGQDAQSYVELTQDCYSADDSCNAEGCAALASCCPASGSCCKPVDDPPLPAALDFTTCAGQTVGACMTADDLPAESVGASMPVLSERGLVPNGSATSEGGVLLGEPVDLMSQRVVVDVRFTLPIGCGGTCLESVGIAFTSSKPGAIVDADVGLLLSGAREAVSLMVGGAVMDTFDAGSDNTVWSLVLSPGGTAEVKRDGNPLGSYGFDPTELAQARLAVYGRNLSATPNSAAIAYLGVDTELCDNPSAWTDRIPTIVRVQGQASSKHMTGIEPSIADGPATKVAFEIDGQIFVGDQEMAGLVDLDTPEPTVFATEPFEAGGMGDPELIWFGDLLYVFYTARDVNGIASIGMVADAQNAPGVKRPTPALAPEGNVASFDSPSVVAHDGLLVMLARATLHSGATELRAFYANSPDGDWEPVIGGGLEAISRIDDPTSEVTSPSLIVHNSAYHLYYARRTGTRWAVELAVSNELLIWRPIGEVLGGSGEGFDSLGARGPDAISRIDRIDLVYAGQNGVSFQLGSATRSAPSDTALNLF